MGNGRKTDWWTHKAVREVSEKLKKNLDRAGFSGLLVGDRNVFISACENFRQGCEIIELIYKLRNRNLCELHKLRTSIRSIELQLHHRTNYRITTAHAIITTRHLTCRLSLTKRRPRMGFAHPTSIHFAIAYGPCTFPFIERKRTYETSNLKRNMEGKKSKPSGGWSRF